MQTNAMGRLGPVPVIGIGTWNSERAPAADLERAVHRAIELGAHHVDTAEMYGRGVVEERLGKALAGKRDRVFLVSKVLPENASYAGTLAACERSLQRLATDRLDCYLLHWRGPHPLAETFRALEELETAGKIRGWGVSNFDRADLDEALAAAGPGRIACNQVLYHLEERTIEHEVVGWCEANGVAVVGYSPFGSGDFPAPTSKGGQVLAAIARDHGVTARQVALAFLTRRPSLLAIPKAVKVDHVDDNCGAGDLVLSHEAIAQLEEAFPLGRWRGLQSI
jgi:diketogulonate reductase-like aldo/keto reductase